jgi:azurin
MKSLFLKSIFAALLLSLAACGGDDTDTNGQADATVDDDVRTIEIIGTDDMKFVVREAADGLVTGGASGDYILLDAIEAEPGEEIRITLTTISNLPASAMSHNLALLEQGTDLDEFVSASITARDNEYIAPDFEDQVIVATAMLGDGESDTITFTAPDESGEYDYVCTFPGHFQGGMVGQLIVQ